MTDTLEPTRRTFLAGVAAAGASLAIPAASLAFADSKGTQSEAEWRNAPTQWRLDGPSLVCTADPKTDFWRKTFYGYTTDNGHFYHRRVAGDFTTMVKISGQYHDLYDQAELMVRIDAEKWMKCGVEFVDGKQNMSIVYTRESSSWATGRLPEGATSLWLNVVRKGPALDIFHSLDGSHFGESGVGYLGSAESVKVGSRCALRLKVRDLKFVSTTGR